MGNKKSNEKDRRSFLSLLFTGKDSGTNDEKPDMVKMLTAEGKLVEISKAALEEASQKKKATNKEIYNWMKNPSKENP